MHHKGKLFVGARQIAQRRNVNKMFVTIVIVHVDRTRSRGDFFQFDSSRGHRLLHRGH